MHVFNCEELYKAYKKRPYDTWIKVHALISADYVRGFGLSEADAKELATAELNIKINTARKSLPPCGKLRTKNRQMFILSKPKRETNQKLKPNYAPR